MVEQLDIMIGTTKKTVYIQRAFYNSPSILSPTHNHYHAEVHIISHGSMEFSINNKTYTINDGCVFAIPSKIFHSCTKIAENTKHTSFLINAPINKIITKYENVNIIEDFFEEIKQLDNKKNYSKISSYISLLCSSFFPEEKVLPKHIENYALTINEFFSQLYSEDVKLSDLAKMLHLSEKQTSRLVIKYTGNTFKDELIKKRMEVAKFLINSGTMSLSDIGHYVGYNSYVGFWKALNAYNKTNHCE